MRPMYIGGQFTTGQATGAIEAHNSATEEALDSFPRGTPADAAAAVAAAKAAFRSWRGVAANERAKMLHDVSAKIRARWDEIVRLLTLKEGKPIL